MLFSDVFDERRNLFARLDFLGGRRRNCFDFTALRRALPPGRGEPSANSIPYAHTKGYGAAAQKSVGDRRRNWLPFRTDATQDNAECKIVSCGTCIKKKNSNRVRADIKNRKVESFGFVICLCAAAAGLDAFFVVRNARSNFALRSTVFKRKPDTERRNGAFWHYWTAVSMDSAVIATHGDAVAQGCNNRHGGSQAEFGGLGHTWAISASSTAPCRSPNARRARALR